MLMMMNFSLSLIFMLLNHPMTMGLILLIQTITVSMITGMLNTNFWFSYILFLIMIGGLLVLFIYMTSIASNEMFNYSNKTIMYMSLMIIMLILIYLFLDNFFININLSYLENYFNIYENQKNLTKYFNYPSMLMIFFSIIYLFITLVAVVKITKIEYGPLRQIN